MTPMPIVFIIEVKNQLENSRRCIEVYHHHTGIADIICFNQSISLSLQALTGSKHRDYLQISVENREEFSQYFYIIDLPSWAHFHLNLKGQSGINATYSGGRNILKLSLSYDFLRIKIFRPTGSNLSAADCVAIQDSLRQWPQPLPSRASVGDW
jgi:hypothetical protein